MQRFLENGEPVSRSSRRWVATFLLVVAVVLVSPFATAQEGERSNVLWFVIDDMSAHFSCYGETLIETPHTDRLAREGARFTSAYVTSAYVTSPVCSPSRSAMITGCYQTSIGAHQHRSGRGGIKIHLPDGVEPAPALFRNAGYHTCIGSGLPGLDHRGLPQPESAPRRRLSGKTDYNFEWDPSIYASHDWADREPGQPFFMQVQLHGGKLREGAPETREAFRRRVAEDFAPSTDPEAELYDYRADPHQVRNLASDPDFAEALSAMREELDRVLLATRDPGPESEANYDSEIAEYRKRENPERESNIRLMKQWAAEGK